MAVFETWIESDLQKMIVPRALPGNAFCMDSGANLIGVSVMDGGEPATLSGTVAGKVVRSDGTTVPVTGGTLSGNKASIILPQRAYEVPGPIAIAVTLTSGSTVTTIGAVTGYVVRSQTDSIIDPGTILPTIDTLINQIQTAIDSIPADYSQVIHSIAPSFSSSTAYSAGDMVWYPGEATNPGALYQFTSAHAAGEWTGTDATAVVFANELSSLKSAIKLGSGYDIIPLTLKKYIDLSGASVTMENGVPKYTGVSTTYDCGFYPCSTGDKFTINGVGGNQTRLWGFVSSAGTILDRSVASATASGLVITAPENSAWIIIHTNNGKRSYWGIPVVKALSDKQTEIENLSNTIADNKSYILQTVSDNCETSPIKITNGYYVDLSGSTVTMSGGVPQPSGTSTTYGYAAVSCSPGDMFTINGTGGSQPRLYAFVKTNGDIITTSRATAGETATNLVITAPTDAAWLVINTSESKISYKGKLPILRIVDNSNQISDIDSRLMAEIPLDWRVGNIGANDGINYSSTTRARTAEHIAYSESIEVTIGNGVQIAFRMYDAQGDYLRGSANWISTGGKITDLITNTTNVATIRIVARYANDATVSSAINLGNNIKLLKPGNLKDVYAVINGNTEGIYINSTGRGNSSIRCAKEQSYVDGSHPVIEWYLLEEPNTGRFYYSKDLSEKKYLFTFPYDAYKYSVGILQNNDIIFVMDADSITLDNKDDANRVNPYVFLASENWAICHEVDFGSALKPCGWLGNSGFKVIANGDALFCEYTRQTTYTCNVWKLSGDPLNASNWVVTKSFVVTSTDNATLFKHAHMVMQDFYTGVCYMSTGDDLIGAMMWASTDNGSTWTQLVSPDSDGQVNQYGYINGSEKYCRCLTMTFTKDYIYWATDSSSATLHWLFKAQRDANGVLDYSTVIDYVNIPANNGASTYGTAYVPELNAIVLLDRCDVVATEMDLKLVTLDDGQLYTFGKLESASGSRNIGFRTRFSEWYPKNGLIHFGFAMHIGRLTNAINQNKGFNNSGSGDHPENNINNLAMQVYKTGNNFGMAMHTEFI